MAIKLNSLVPEVCSDVFEKTHRWKTRLKRGLFKRYI